MTPFEYVNPGSPIGEKGKKKETKNTRLSYNSRPCRAILINLDSLSSIKTTLAQIRGKERKRKQWRIQKITEKEVEALLISGFGSQHKTGIPMVKQGISLTFDCHLNQTCEVKIIMTLPRLLFQRMVGSLHLLKRSSMSATTSSGKASLSTEMHNVFLQLVHRSCTNDWTCHEWTVRCKPKCKLNWS